jgi:hypothetical protein
MEPSMVVPLEPQMESMKANPMVLRLEVTSVLEMEPSMVVLLAPKMESMKADPTEPWMEAT